VRQKDNVNHSTRNTSGLLIIDLRQAGGTDKSHSHSAKVTSTSVFGTVPVLRTSSLLHYKSACFQVFVIMLLEMGAATAGGSDRNPRSRRHPAQKVTARILSTRAVTGIRLVCG
jgi:hypothetical protein